MSALSVGLNVFFGRIRTVSVFISVFVIVFMFSSCNVPSRFDRAELERQLVRIDKNFGFDECERYEEDGIFYVFYGSDEKKILLKTKEDEKSRLVFLSLTLMDMQEPTVENFSSLACALTDIFVPEGEGASFKSCLGLEDTSRYFTDETAEYESGRYSAVFFKTVKGVSLMLEYK